MRETKSSGGLTRVRGRNRESVHKLWVALINRYFGDALANSSKRGGSTKAAIHSDLTKSPIKKNFEIFGKLLTWFKDTSTLQNLKIKPN